MFVFCYSHDQKSGTAFTGSFSRNLSTQIYVSKIGITSITLLYWSRSFSIYKSVKSAVYIKLHNNVLLEVKIHDISH